MNQFITGNKQAPEFENKDNGRNFIYSFFSSLVFIGLLLSGCDEDDPAGPDDTDFEVEAEFTIEPENPSLGDEVTLDGTGSSISGDGDLEFSWSLDTPPESNAQLDSDSDEITGFTADATGDFEVELEVSANGASDMAIDVAEVTAEEDISSDITEERTLISEVRYFVTDEIEIEAELIIEPGTMIEFENGTGFEVTQSSGAINADGTEEEPILFTGTSEQPGWWNGIYLEESNNLNNVLNYVTVEYAGGTEFRNSGSGNVIIGRNHRDDSSIEITNSTLRHSATNGVWARSNADLAEFENNTLTDNQGYPVSIASSKAQQVDSGSSYTGNENDVVYVRSDNDIEDDNVTWSTLEVPYQVSSGTIEVLGVDLTIEAGTTLEFEQGGQLRLNEHGGLLADGTEADPILFTGTSEQPGWWHGIYLEESSSVNNRLDHVTVEYAGGQEFRNSGSGNVIISRNHRDESSIEISNSTLRHSATSGVWVRSSGNLSEFENNTLNSNQEYPVNIASNRVHQLDAGSDYTGNENDMVYIRGGNDLDSQDVTWQGLEVPYFVNSEPVEVIGVNLTIDPGATFVFERNGQLSIEDNGGLNAVGTNSDPIVFTSENEQPGWWNGIYFEESSSPINELDYVTVEFGGGTEYRNSGSGNIVIGRQFRDDSYVDITNSTLHHSDTHGLWVDSDSEVNEDACDVNTFENNSSEDCVIE